MAVAAAVEAAIKRLNNGIVDHPRVIIIAFLLLTAGFAGGLMSVGMGEGGLDAFTEGLPEQNALDDVNENFQQPFAPDTETTQSVS